MARNSAFSTGIKFRCLSIILCSGIFASLSFVEFAQAQLSVVREIQLQGSFQRLIGDELSMTDVDGKMFKLRVQAARNQPIGLTGGDIALEQPADISVNAKVSPTVLLPGMVLQLKCKLGAGGKTESIQSAALLPIGSEPGDIAVEQMPDGRELVDATVEGRIKSLDDKRIVLSVSRHKLVPRQTLAIESANIPTMEYITGSLGMLQVGDVITRVDAADVSTGDTVVRRMSVDLVGERSDLKLTVDEELQLKHIEKSNQPGEPREFRSQHYLMVSDISDRQAAVLLDKLEYMFLQVSDYYGRQPGDLLQLFVVDDVNKWDLSDWEPRGIKKVKDGEGFTIWRRTGGVQNAVVYSSSKHDVVQHEALHGFCYLTFQSTGPLWYAEGMAEMGQYWQANDLSVNAEPAVVGYLRSRKPVALNGVINATNIEGEAWKAYAWRWSLCHFLAFNPNYSSDFRKLGISLMRSGRGASFVNTYRRTANELTFEYHHFLKHLESGLRADLIAWQWNVKFGKTGDARAVQKKIQAARGWQATGALVEKGIDYETRAKGKWTLAEGEEATDADGDSNGDGRLIGVILNDKLELSDEFDLGVKPDFTATQDGRLYVRCRERMSLISDNTGEVDFAIRKKK